MLKVHCLQFMSCGAMHTSQMFRCGSEASIPVGAVQTLYFCHLYVWWCRFKYELAEREGALDRVGEADFECSSVGGVDDPYTVCEHGVVLDDAASGDDFRVVPLRGLDADPGIVHRAPEQIFDLGDADEIVPDFLWSGFDGHSGAVIVDHHLHFACSGVLQIHR